MFDMATSISDDIVTSRHDVASIGKPPYNVHVKSSHAMQSIPGFDVIAFVGRALILAVNSWGQRSGQCKQGFSFIRTSVVCSGWQSSLVAINFYGRTAVLLNEESMHTFPEY